MAARGVLAKRGELQEERILRIDDEASRHQAEVSTHLERLRREFLNSGGQESAIVPCQLFDRHDEIVKIVDDFVATAGDSVVIDISAMPKRFLFPIVKLLLRSGVSNIVVTYAIPERYGDPPLAEDPEPWRHLPMFMPPYPEPNEKVLIVSVGYEPLGLPQLLDGEDFQRIPVKLLFPFPSAPEGIRRNWEFVRQLSPNVGTRLGPGGIVRVNGHDVSECYDRLRGLTEDGRIYSLLAPYGPKPMSLAMCLFSACVERSYPPPAVYYTQPRVYNPRYSSGLRLLQGWPAVLAYVVRLDGRELY